MKEILKVEGLSKSFPMERDHSITLKSLLKPKELFLQKRDEFYAVSDVSFSLVEGECLGLVGESGAGKTTLCLAIARLLEFNSGRVYYRDQEISSILPSKFANHELRTSLQMMFQDPTEALNPAFTAFRTIANPLISLLKMHDKKAIRRRVDELADMAYFPLRLLDRYPHQLSGGEKARVGIARALATNPDLILLDEPTSALDVSVQGGVLLHLEELRKELNLTFLFVSHDLSVVRLMCERVMVIETGRIIEEGGVEEIFENPKHKHTQDLISSIPHIDRRSA
jgi:peptide/nickel transport system ATP-binding protein